MTSPGSHPTAPPPAPRSAANNRNDRRTNMKSSVSRRTFVASAMAVVAAPFLGKGAAAAADAPLTLRCSLETAPSHTRNVVIKDYLGRIEAAAGGKIKTQLFESGQL